jgi:crotonobetainyl-CoA:carnitine CoA-transferase CaiB-like acyl-CoA transferase
VGATGSAIRTPGMPPLASPAPVMAADQADVLGELGFTADEIDELRREGAL